MKSNSIVDLCSENARVRAALVNSERCASFEEADASLAATALEVVLGDDACRTAAGQAAYLTAVATASRCFGQVSVSGALDHPLLRALPVVAGSRDLRQAALALGARAGAVASGYQVVIGAEARAGARSIQTYWDGWIAGTLVAGRRTALGRGDNPLAGIAAGALAVGRAFLAEQGDVRAATIGALGSLWRPDQKAREPGPEIRDCSLPLDLWLIGLGNLGQAYLWSFSMLPFPQPGRVRFVLQDDDTVGPENWGTSLLVQRSHYGWLKTRAAEVWVDACGFHARRIDRRLDEYLQRAQHEPGLVLAGLDRMAARRLLANRGFDYVIDGGLGGRVSNYTRVRVNVFDRNGDPAEHFADGNDDPAEQIAELMSKPAYRQLAEVDRCGAAILAGQSVAVPFVSAYAGALVVSQSVRLASVQAPHRSIATDTRDITDQRASLGVASERPCLSTTPAASA